jgi:hypothetical protein
MIGRQEPVAHLFHSSFILFTSARKTFGISGLDSADFGAERPQIPWRRGVCL